MSVWKEKGEGEMMRTAYQSLKNEDAYKRAVRLNTENVCNFFNSQSKKEITCRVWQNMKGEGR